jgi:hypothetical protein
VVILKFMNKLVHCIMTLSPLWQVQTNTTKIRKGFHEYNSWASGSLQNLKTKKMHPQLINKLESNPSKII